MAIKLPRLNEGWDNQPGLFARWWNQAMDTIEQNINDILHAQEVADQAVADAASAQNSADGAQLTADDALVLAVTAVQQDVGPSWGASSGTESRASYPSYTAPTILDPPTAAEVQGIADEVQTISQLLVALITDLRDNGVLTE